MNSWPREALPWTPRRWGWTIGVLFVAQAGLAWFLADRTPLIMRPSPAPTRYRLLTDESQAEALAVSLADSDPALLALVSAHNFSGVAWLQRPQVTHQLADWSERPVWLPPRLDRLGASFGLLARQPAGGAGIAADQPAPPIAVLLITNEPVITRSTLRQEGALAERPMVTALDLPAWTNKTVLTNTEVRIIVGLDGRTFSAILQESCGLTNADQRALELARTARFQPLARLKPGPALEDAWSIPSLQWGGLIFQWATIGAAPPESSPDKTPP